MIEVPTGAPAPFDEVEIPRWTRRLYCSRCPREARVSVRLEGGEVVDCCWAHYQELAETLRDESE